MSTSISFNLIECKTYPTVGDYVDVVGKVTWEIVFSDGVSFSNSLLETLLPVDSIDPETFVSLEDLTKEAILEMAKAHENVENVISLMQETHEANLSRLTRATLMVSVDVESLAD